MPSEAGARTEVKAALAFLQWTRQQMDKRGRERRMRYRVEGSFVRDSLSDIPLVLLVIGGGKRPKGSRHKNYKPCFFLVSAILIEGVWSLPFSIFDTLTLLWQQWELEVVHRQMKSGLGMGEKQCWNDKATVATVQWSTWVYTLMMLTGYRVWGNDCGAKLPGQWRTRPHRWSFNTLWSGIRAEMWQQLDFQTTWTWSRDNWLGNDSLSDNLFNSTLASARV